MHPFSVLTLGIFVAGYITARWDLVTRLYELAIFAWDHGVVVRQIRCNYVVGSEALIWCRKQMTKYNKKKKSSFSCS